MSAAKTKSVPAVERALTLLELLANSTTGLTMVEIARRLELPRSSAHYLLRTLERRGYLHRNMQTGRYMFALRLFSLANMALSGLRVREQATPFLKSLMKKTQLTVHMAILEQNEVVLVEKVEPPGLLRLATWMGKRMPVHCTGVGKALIAYLPEAEVERLFKPGLLRYNENTITSVRRLKDELERIRRLGFAVDEEEETIGLRCVGAPILDSTGQAIAAISVAGTTSQISGESLSSIATQVKQTALAISEQLGFNPKTQNEWLLSRGSQHA